MKKLEIGELKRIYVTKEFGFFYSSNCNSSSKCKASVYLTLFKQQQLAFKINADIIIIKALCLLELLIVTLLHFFLILHLSKSWQAYSGIMLDSMLILLLNKNIDYVLIGHIQYVLYAIIILNEHKHLFSTNWNYFNPKIFSFWLALYYKVISTRYDIAAHSWYRIMHEYIVYKQNYK